MHPYVPSTFSYSTDHYLKYPMMIIRLWAVDDEDLKYLLNDAWNTRVAEYSLSGFCGAMRTICKSCDF